MNNMSPEDRLTAFMSRYPPEIASLASAVLAKMRARLPGAVELVYDNYNALVVGFGPTERSADAVFSIALYPRWINLFFLRGATLPDPQRLLKGSGKAVRHIVINDPADLDAPAVRELMERALESAPKELDTSVPRRMVINSISAKQRPRRRPR